jgi:hypothetical protein
MNKCDRKHPSLWHNRNGTYVEESVLLSCDVIYLYLRRRCLLGMSIRRMMGECDHVHSMNMNDAPVQPNEL